jgi:predicted amidohydrolase
MSILIKNGRIVTSNDDAIADIYIEGETIKAIGKNLEVKADKEIDASGMCIWLCLLWALFRATIMKRAPAPLCLGAPLL